MHCKKSAVLNLLGFRHWADTGKTFLSNAWTFFPFFRLIVYQSTSLLRWKKVSDHQKGFQMGSSGLLRWSDSNQPLQGLLLNSMKVFHHHSLDWKDRVCQTVKKAFVCLSVCLCVCLSVCNPFLRPQWNLLSAVWKRRVLVCRIKTNLGFSLLIDRFCALWLSCSLEDRVLWLIRLFCVSVPRNHQFWNLNLSLCAAKLLLDRWFYCNRSKVLHWFDVWLPRVCNMF